ncbi:G patch domain-containing protein 1-like [Tropilaelaps mercedesae]|uniref:G patch domain-containing protein 1-like n=1 Tax=Tropilaelaps mercedesae TaxID=418985 RepID=A0A1V9X4C9_9ACAR|nr:G patch domain-containing protein 1-like [Tropilaelaps mercedesae]
MENYTHYGTPLRELDDEEGPKKFQDDTVRDGRGRRRFHGAFTGGFSAGYFNSVGTKEGWTPQNFVSSRAKRAENIGGQRPEDFMDSEDFGEMGIAPQRIQLREGVRTRDGGNSQPEYSRTAGVGSQRELLQAPLIRMLTTDRESIGVRILRSMGWRPGRGLGPSICLKASYGPQLPTSISGEAEIGPDEVADDILQAINTVSGGKDNVWGLGYSPAQRLDLFGERIDRERVTMSTATVEGRRLGIRGQAFGVGAFEDDDEDIYGREDMTQYEFEEVDHKAQDKRGALRRNEYAMLESKQSQAKGRAVEGFVAVEEAEMPSDKLSHVSGPRVEIPSGWTPRAAMLAVAAQLEKAETSIRTRKPTKDMSLDDKVALISDKAEGSVFNLISPEDKVRIEAAKKAIRGRNNETQMKTVSESKKLVPPPSLQNEEEFESGDREGLSKDLEDESVEDRPLSTVEIESLKPFASNPAKQERFDRFVRFAELGHKEMLQSIQPLNMSRWEAALETKEFDSALLLVRPQLGLSSRFKKTVEHDSGHEELPTGLSTSKDVAAVQTLYSEKAPARHLPIRSLKDFGTNTHGQVEWHPKSLLCKRFNVQNPYPGDDTFGIPFTVTSSSSKASASPSRELVTESTGTEESSSSTCPPHKKVSQLLAKAPASSVLGSFAVKRFDDLIHEEEAKTPPPLDFFKFIFSDDEDEDNDDNENPNNDLANSAKDKMFAQENAPSIEKVSNEEASSAKDTIENNCLSSFQPRSKDGGQMKKSSGLFADLDLSLLNKRPPPKPISALTQPSATGNVDSTLPPMGPKPPPIIPVGTTLLITKSPGHHHHRSHSSRRENRKDSKKRKKMKKKSAKKLKKKNSKKRKKGKSPPASAPSSSCRRRKCHEHDTDSTDRERGFDSSSGESDTDTDASDDDNNDGTRHDDEKRLDQRLRKK